jgi:hypothetical protein
MPRRWLSRKVVVDACAFVHLKPDPCPLTSGLDRPQDIASALGIDIGSEADATVLRYDWPHEFMYRREDTGDRFIVSGEFLIEPCFELRESPR